MNSTRYSVEPIKWVIGVPVGLFAAMMLLGAAIKSNEAGRPAPVMTEKQSFENSATECWKSYERKSLSPMEKRQIASFCEGLEQRAKDAK